MCYDISAIVELLSFAEWVRVYGDTILMGGGDGALSFRWVWRVGCFAAGVEVEA